MDRKRFAQSVCVYGTRADFPEQAVLALAECIDSLPETAMDYLDRIGAEYKTTEKLTYAMQESFEASAAPVHRYAAQMLFYMAFLPILEKKYHEKRIPEAFFDRVLFDLRAKLLECKEVYGVWGSFVAIWFARFFNFTLYGIERLEFAPIRAEYDYEGQGVTVKKGDSAIDVHIPSGAPLPHEEVMHSYRRASDFFGSNVFVCESWMLYPAHREMLAECPNLKAFFRDYDVLESGEDTGDLWRIFGAEQEKSPAELPRDTALRRVYADRLAKGLPVGWGKGIYILK